jgi:hypothetical protein
MTGAVYQGKGSGDGVDGKAPQALQVQEVMEMTGISGFKLSPTVKEVFSGVSDGRGPEATRPAGMVGDGLWERCQARKSEGMDTSQVERYIEEGRRAEAQGKDLYAQLMFQIAFDSLQ